MNKKQAETIKMIYKLYLLGKSLYGIKQELERLNLETPMHKKVWHISTIKSILTNEKYKGDALLQKQYTVDFLTKKRKTNEGEIPQYYVTDDHEPIIDKKTFDLVQIEREKRKNKALETYISDLKLSKNKLTDFDEGLFYALVDRVKVNKNSIMLIVIWIVE